MTATSPYTVPVGSTGTGSVEPARRPTTTRSLVPFAVVATAFGTLLIALAYAGSRAHHSWAPVPFWLGWGGSFVAMAVVATSSRASARERVSVVVLQAAQQSLVRWMYSPLAFTFPDELQHIRTVADILTFHHLFHYNPTLPVSPVFPGLEEWATSLMSLAHVGVFPAGLVISAAAHLSLSVAMFAVFRRVCGNERVAGVAAFVFALNPLHAGFDTQFIYGVPALLLGAAVLDLAMSDAPNLSADSAIGLICFAALIVTHHLTAAVTIGIVAVVALVLSVLTRLDRSARRMIWVALAGAGMAAAWVGTEARPVLPYLGGPLGGVINGILRFGDVKGTVALPATKGGSPGGWLTILGTAITAVLIIAGGVVLWRRRSAEGERALPRAFALCALSYFAVLGIREFAADGAELAGRLLTYAFVFTSVPVAFALMPTWKLRNGFHRFARPLAIVALLGIFLGGMMSGWPAPWEQLPGTFRVAGFESGVDRQNMSAMHWFRAHVGRNQRVACDVTACALLGAYAAAHPIPDEPGLFYAPSVTSGVIQILRHRQVAYLFVDLRMSRETPVTGHFFQVNNTHAGEEDGPVSLAALTKFQHIPGVDVIYDSGTIEIYQVQSLPHE